MTMTLNKDALLLISGILITSLLILVQGRRQAYSKAVELLVRLNLSKRTDGFLAPSVTFGSASIWGHVSSFGRLLMDRQAMMLAKYLRSYWRTVSVTCWMYKCCL